MEKTNLDESFDLAEKILLYISKNEPLDNEQVKSFIKNSGIDDKKMKLNIERLKKAGFLDGRLFTTLNSEYFEAAADLKLSYEGMKEVKRLLVEKGIIKNVELNLGLIKFSIGPK